MASYDVEAEQAARLFLEYALRVMEGKAQFVRGLLASRQADPLTIQQEADSLAGLLAAVAADGFLAGRVHHPDFPDFGVADYERASGIYPAEPEPARAAEPEAVVLRWLARAAARL